MKAFEALADPTRRRILEILAEGEQTVSEIARQFTITQPAVSQQLRTLLDAGLVSVRREAQRRIYTIDGRGLAEIDAWLSRYKTFWNTHLEALERALHEGDLK